jgi:hypothetical protein
MAAVFSPEHGQDSEKSGQFILGKKKTINLSGRIAAEREVVIWHFLLQQSQFCRHW